MTFPITMATYLVKMEGIEISGECSSHISMKSKGNNDVTLCKKCGEYETQLKEALDELISIRMINELLQKELLSYVTSKSTWGIDPDSTDNNVQPFKNWPSRHSSKMSYNEVAAHKPYTVTKNCFQLLDNQHVEDFPEEVRRNYNRMRDQKRQNARNNMNDHHGRTTMQHPTD